MKGENFKMFPQRNFINDYRLYECSSCPFCIMKRVNVILNNILSICTTFQVQTKPIRK